MCIILSHQNYTKRQLFCQCLYCITLLKTFFFNYQFLIDDSFLYLVEVRRVKIVPCKYPWIFNVNRTKHPGNIRICTYLCEELYSTVSVELSIVSFNHEQSFSLFGVFLFKLFNIFLEFLFISETKFFFMIHLSINLLNFLPYFFQLFDKVLRIFP